jgi:hypothetical protein
MEDDGRDAEERRRRKTRSSLADGAEQRKMERRR